MEFVYNTATVEIGDTFIDEDEKPYVYLGSNTFKK